MTKKNLPCSNCFEVVSVPKNALQVWCDDCGNSPGARGARKMLEKQAQALKKRGKKVNWDGVRNFCDPSPTKE